MTNIKSNHLLVTSDGSLTREITLCGDSQADEFCVFAFGSYDPRYIAVGRKTRCSSVDVRGAREIAAAELSPSYFIEPDYKDACEDLEVDFAEFQAASDTCKDFEKVREAAEIGLTYTESGYIASCECTIVGKSMDRAALLAFARGE